MIIHRFDLSELTMMGMKDLRTPRFQSRVVMMDQTLTMTLWMLMMRKMLCNLPRK